MKNLRNGIFVKSNAETFHRIYKLQFISKISLAYLTFFNDVEEHEFPLTVPKRTSKGGLDFSLQSPEFYSCIQFEIRKRLAR